MIKLKKIILWLRRIVITGISIVVLLYSIAYLLPAPHLGKSEYIKAYDQKSQLFYQSQQQSDDVSLDDVSTDFLASLVAIEDHRFFNHRGFDPISIMRALKANFVSGEKSQGASSISQQYARLLFLTNQKTWSRKLTEAFLTMRIEAHYNKKTILQGYMNTVYFGHGLYGISQASKYYFNKTPKELDLNEASMLAGVINGPEYYSPFLHPQQAKKRQKLVLNKLVELKYITQNKADEVYQTDFQLNKNRTSSFNNQYPYFRDAVIQELKRLGFYTDEYMKQGLNIYTTLDSDIQNQLNKTVEKHTKDREDLEVSSIIVNSKTSQVLALIGGKDYSTSQFNRATSSQRQIGSTMKPILYYLALNNGFTPTTKFKSEATTFKLDNGQTYSPTNYNKKYANKDITLAQAIAVSDNIYAVKTHLFLGEQALVNMLHQFGFEHVSPHPSLALGTLHTNVYNLAKVYTTFANTGIYNDLHLIEKITNDQGKVLYEYKPLNQQLLNKETCLILNQLLTSPFQKEFQTYASPTMMSYPVKTTFAVKTGSSAYDSLCAGYNPHYTIVSWCGYDDNRKMSLSLDTKVPKLIFQTMANSLQKEDIWYKPTSSLQVIPINPISGDYQENGLEYWFKTG